MAADNKKKPTAGQKKTANKKPIKQKKQNKDKKDDSIRLKKQKILTHKGEPLSVLQAKFIDKYIELGVGRQAVIEAGYKVKNPDIQANILVKTPKILDEINWRMEQSKKESIAKSEEILEYYTKVMRGEINDQFGLEAPLSERTKAASELAKRLIDIPNKLEAIATGRGNVQGTVKIELNWDGMEDTTDEGEENQKEE